MALLPTDSVDSHTLRLQKDLSEGALEREEREEGRRGEEEEEEGGGLGLLGVGVLWRWGGDEGGLSVALQGESIECMSEVLSRFPRQHRYWVEVCSVLFFKFIYLFIYLLGIYTHYPKRCASNLFPKENLFINVSIFFKIYWILITGEGVTVETIKEMLLSKWMRSFVCW